MSKLILFGVFLVWYIPFCIKWHKAGVERYRKYDRMAFYDSLSADDKESLDYYYDI